MEKSDNKSYILSLLKKRNEKEQSFKEIIKHSSKLLESLDLLQKEYIQQQLYTAKASEGADESAEVSLLKAKHHGLQKELAECHCKISSLAEQVINLKDDLDDKNTILQRQNSKLKDLQNELTTCQGLSQKYKSQADGLKTTLQARIDDYNTLNITYSCIEKRLHDLEIENDALKAEIIALKENNRSLSPVVSENEIVDHKGKYNVDSGTRRKCIHETKISSPKHSANSVGTKDDIALPRRIKHEFVVHDDHANAVMWLPDSSENLLTAGADRRVKLWEINDSKVELKTNVRDCNSSILSLDVDSETRFVLSASCDFASRIWSTSDFTLKHTLTGHSGKVLSAKFLKDQCKIISGSTDQTLKLWDFGRRVCTVTYTTHSAVNDVLSKDSSCIVSGHCDNKIRFWDTRMDNEISSLTTTGKVTSLDVSNNGFYLLASEDSRLKLFDTRTRKELNSMTARNFAVGCNWTRAKFSPNDKYCCCGSKNGSIFIWNPYTGALETELKYDNSNVICCGWSACGAYLASCGSNNKCIIWSK